MRGGMRDAEFRPDAGCRRGMRDAELRPDAECRRGMRSSGEAARFEFGCGMGKGRGFTLVGPFIVSHGRIHLTSQQLVQHPGFLFCILHPGASGRSSASRIPLLHPASGSIGANLATPISLSPILRASCSTAAPLRSCARTRSTGQGVRPRVPRWRVAARAS